MSVNFLTPRFPSFVDTSSLKTIRYSLGGSCLFLFILTLLFSPLLAQLVFMTLWGNLTTLVSTFLSLTHSADSPNCVRSKVVLFLFEFSMCMQVMIVVLYWTQIHHWLMERIVLYSVDHFIQVFIHIIPFLCITASVTFSQVRFKHSHGKWIMIISAIFLMINCVATKIMGRILYPFLPWEELWASIGITIVLVMIVGAVYWVLCKAVNFWLPKEIKL